MREVLKCSTKNQLQNKVVMQEMKDPKRYKAYRKETAK
jgi:hypothetical protein